MIFVKRTQNFCPLPVNRRQSHSLRAHPFFQCEESENIHQNAENECIGEKSMRGICTLPEDALLSLQHPAIPKHHSYCNQKITGTSTSTKTCVLYLHVSVLGKKSPFLFPLNLREIQC